MTTLRSFAVLLVTLFAIAGCLKEMAPVTSVNPPDNTAGNGGSTGTGTAGGALEITAPAAMNAEANAPQSSVSLGNASATGGDGNYVFNNDAPAGGFPLGQTVVNWTVTDGAGAQASATQTVDIVDTIAPTIATPAPMQELATGALTPVTLSNPTVSDLGDPNPIITNDMPAAGFPLGTTNVMWTVTDSSGNSATAMQAVTVSDTPAAPTGPELYATNCAGCHGPLATSTRRGRTAAEITTALATQPQMASISLTAPEIQLIADALADTTSSLVNVMLSSSSVDVNLRKSATVTATIESVGGFAGPVDVSIMGLDPASGSYVVEPSPTAMVPAGGSVDVTIRFNTDTTSLSVRSQPLRVNVQDQNTLTDIDGGSIAYTVNNLLEIQFDLNSGTSGTTHRWNGLRATTLTLRPNTKVIWTNYDTLAAHIVHGNNPIPHGPTNRPLVPPTIAGQPGFSYGANNTVGSFAAGEVIPMTITGGSFYCHSHQDGTSISINIDSTMTPHPN